MRTRNAGDDRLTGEQGHAGRIRRAFRAHFSEEPTLLVRSPGRVNLIGEHTDYNLGFALLGAVDRAVWFAVKPRQDRLCRFHSEDTGTYLTVDLGSLSRSGVPWANYLLGIFSELAVDDMTVSGVDCVFGGDIPIGSGLSSSAALECGLAFALNALFDLKLSRAALATLGQRAENRFVGVACGVMDQFASVLGQKDRLIRLDCRTLDFSCMPFDDRGVRIVLCDSQVRRSLAESEYNLRRAQCSSGVTVLAEAFSGVHSLRDATPEMIDEVRDRLSPEVYRRCRYVVGEIHRVLKACELLQHGDMEGVGVLMNRTHAGLRDDYEVSCVELDILVEEAMKASGVLGSRMMGAGFGGCTINLVRTAALGRFREAMERAFRDRLKRPPLFHLCRLTNGTSGVA